jgi:hypothetical protein
VPGDSVTALASSVATRSDELYSGTSRIVPRARGPKRRICQLTPTVDTTRS